MLNRRTTAAAARWLRRRQAEGVFSSESPNENDDAVGLKNSNDMNRSIVAAALQENAREEQHALASSSDRSSSNLIRRSLVTAIFEQQQHQHHRTHLLNQCLSCLQAQRFDATSPVEFSAALKNYLVLASRLVSTPAVLPKRNSADHSGDHWLHALHLFLTTVASQQQRRSSRSSFRSLAFDSSPDWGAAWILLCKEMLPTAPDVTRSPAVVKATGNNSSSSSSSSYCSLSSSPLSPSPAARSSFSPGALAMCAAVTHALLPLANNNVQQQIRAGCSARIDQLEKNARSQVLQLEASLQSAAEGSTPSASPSSSSAAGSSTDDDESAQIARGRNAAVLRVFLLAFHSGSQSVLVGSTAEDAALRALRKLLSEQAMSLQVIAELCVAVQGGGEQGNAATSFLLSGLVGGKQSSTMRRTININFHTWCTSSSGPALVILAEVCSSFQQNSSSSSSNGVNVNTAEHPDAHAKCIAALEKVISNGTIARGSSGAEADGVRVSATAAVVAFLSRYLSPFGEMGDALTAAAATSPTNVPSSSDFDAAPASRADALRSALPLLQLSASILAHVAFARGSSEADAWAFVSLALRATGRSSQQQQQQQQQSVSSIAAANTLASLASSINQQQQQSSSRVSGRAHAQHGNNSNNNNNNKQQHLFNLHLLRRTADILQVSLLVVGMQLVQQQHLQSPLLLQRADALVVAPLLSKIPSQQLSGASVSSHVSALFLSRANMISSALMSNSSSSSSSNERRSSEDAVRTAYHALGLRDLAIELFKLEQEQQQHQASSGSCLETLFSRHREWLLRDATALAAVISHSTWHVCLRAVEHKIRDGAGSRIRAALSGALAANAMWREAIAVASPSDAQRLCRHLLEAAPSPFPHQQVSSSSSCSSPSSNSSTRWELAVSLLTEMSARHLTLRPSLLVSLLKLLNNASAPRDVEVNMTIQMSRRKQSETRAGDDVRAMREENKQQDQDQDQVVNLLVSVTRQVVEAAATSSNDMESISSGDGLLQARVLALSSLLASQQQNNHQGLTAATSFLSSASSKSSHSGTRLNRRLAGSLRAAMLLCADTGDWSAALYLIAAVAKQQQQNSPEHHPQRSSLSSSSSFTLSPDVIWKVSKALEAAGQGHRVDQLRQYVASQDVAEWLSDGADHNLLDTVPILAAAPPAASTTSAVNTNDRIRDINNSSSSSSSRKGRGGSEDHDETASRQLFDGIHLAEFLRLRSSAVQKLSAMGKWRTAAAILADMHLKLRDSAALSDPSSNSANTRSSNSSTGTGSDDNVASRGNTEQLARAVAATIFVCSTRHHWAHALSAFSLFQIQGTTASAAAFSMPLSASMALIRCLSRVGRWQEAVSVFSASPALYKAHSSASPSSAASLLRWHQQKQRALASGVFTTLTRACRVSRSWESALALHNARPDLVTFASASEVVAACSASGFPLTKIQLWLNMAQSNLFLVSSSSEEEKSSSDGSNNNNNTDRQGGEEQHGDEQKKTPVSLAATTALDVSVFFALLNAQSYASSSAPAQHQPTNDKKNSGNHSQGSDAEAMMMSTMSSYGAWRRSLELLHSCWIGRSSTSSSSSSTLAPEYTSAAAMDARAGAFDAARAPDCVASVIDTCIRQGQWHRAFSIYNMQRLLLVPPTSHSVYLLLSAMLDRVGRGGGGEASSSVADKEAANVSSSSSSSSSSYPFTWRSALRLVSDAVQQQRGVVGGGGGVAATQPRVLQPLVCERLLQVLCRGGAWQQALEFAWVAGPSMGNLLTNDRVLDNFVRHSGNPRVVCRAALASGTFPVSVQHVFGERVLTATRELLEESTGNSSSSHGNHKNDIKWTAPPLSSSFPLPPSSSSSSVPAPWLLALRTLSRCIKDVHSVEHAAIPATLAQLRRSSDDSVATRSLVLPHRNELKRWLSLLEPNQAEGADRSDQHNNRNSISSSPQRDTSSPEIACDVAFAKLVLIVMQKKTVPPHLEPSAEALLRYSLLFGTPSREALLSEWPKRLEMIGFASGGNHLRRVVLLLKRLADEMML